MTRRGVPGAIAGIVIGAIGAVVFFATGSKHNLCQLLGRYAGSSDSSNGCSTTNAEWLGGLIAMVGGVAVMAIGLTMAFTMDPIAVSDRHISPWTIGILAAILLLLVVFLAFD